MIPASLTRPLVDVARDLAASTIRLDILLADRAREIAAWDGPISAKRARDNEERWEKEER